MTLDVQDICITFLPFVAAIGALLGLWRVPLLFRIRIQQFPPSLRGEVLRHKAFLGIGVVVLIVVIPLVTWLGPGAVFQEGKLEPPNELPGVLLIVLVIGSTLGGWVLASRSHQSLRRLRAGEVGKRAPGAVSRFLRDLALPGFFLLAISYIIWFVADQQLTDAESVEMDVVVQLAPELEGRWVVIDPPQGERKVTVKLQGPRADIETVRARRHDLRAFMRVRANEVPSDQELVSITRRVTELFYEFKSGEIPEEVHAVPGDQAEEESDDLNRASPPSDERELPLSDRFRITLAPIRTGGMELNDATIRDRGFINHPPNRMLTIHEVRPAWIYWRAPAPLDMIPFRESPFVPVDIEKLGMIPPGTEQTRNLTLNTSVLSASMAPLVRFYADPDLRESVVSVMVKYSFTYTNYVDREFTDVPLAIELPARCYQEQITLASLPAPLEERVDSITVRGPAEVVNRLTPAMVRVVIRVPSDRIEFAELTTSGAVTRVVLPPYELDVSDPSALAQLELVPDPDNQENFATLTRR